MDITSFFYYYADTVIAHSPPQLSTPLPQLKANSQSESSQSMSGKRITCSNPGFLAADFMHFPALVLDKKLHFVQYMVPFLMIITYAQVKA